MSEETLCFSATIYFDGKKVGYARNNGCGGCNRYDWDSREIRETVEQWANEQETEFKFDVLDQLIDDIIQEYETNKWLKRQCKKKVVFRLKGDKKGEWHLLNYPWCQKAVDFIEERYGDKVECIANERFSPLT